MRRIHHPLHQRPSTRALAADRRPARLGGGDLFLLVEQASESADLVAAFFTKPG